MSQEFHLGQRRPVDIALARLRAALVATVGVRGLSFAAHPPWVLRCDRGGRSHKSHVPYRLRTLSCHLWWRSCRRTHPSPKCASIIWHIRDTTIRQTSDEAVCFIYGAQNRSRLQICLWSGHTRICTIQRGRTQAQVTGRFAKGRRGKALPCLHTYTPFPNSSIPQFPNLPPMFVRTDRKCTFAPRATPRRVAQVLYTNMQTIVASKSMYSACF